METRQSVSESNPIAVGKARLTFLISSEQKERLEAVCAAQEITCSQAVRHLIGEYLERHPEGEH